MVCFVELEGVEADSQALVPKILGQVFLQRAKSQALVPKILGSSFLPKGQIAFGSDKARVPASVSQGGGAGAREGGEGGGGGEILI